MESRDELLRQLDKVTAQIQNFKDMDELAKLWDREDKIRAKLEALDSK